MTTVGKERRLRRLMDPDGDRGVVVPMDHGTSIGPVDGVERPGETAAAVARGGATSLVVHKGLVPPIAEAAPETGIWLHVSASTSLNPDPDDKRVVATAREAVRLGADGLGAHVNVGSAQESRQVEDLGALTRAADELGLPVLAMMYPRGPNVEDPHDVENVAHVARLGAEIGADVVKVPYTGDPTTFRQVAEGCPVPVLISGGPKVPDDEAVLEDVQQSIQAGGAGVSIGRNVWQRDDPEAFAAALAELVLHDASLDAALGHLKG